MIELTEDEKREKLRQKIESEGAVKLPAPLPVEDTIQKEEPLREESESEEEDMMLDLSRSLAFHAKVLNNTVMMSNTAAEKQLDAAKTLERLAERMGTKLEAKETQQPAEGSARSATGAGYYWIVSGAVCFGLAALVTATTLYVTQRRLEESLRKKHDQFLESIQANTIENRLTLQRLAILKTGMEIKREQKGDGYFLILKNVHSVEQPFPVDNGIAILFRPN